MSRVLDELWTAGVLTRLYDKTSRDLGQGDQWSEVSGSAAARVLIELSMHADYATWDCWPSELTIARSARLSRTTVRKALHALESLGMIRRGKRSSRGYVWLVVRPDDVPVAEHHASTTDVPVAEHHMDRDVPGDVPGDVPVPVHKPEPEPEPEPEESDVRSEGGLTSEAPTPTASEATTGCDHHDDITGLSELLANLIVDNGSRPPTVTCKRWHTPLERMVRIDGRTVTEIEGAIRWAQADDFWRANILSPDKLRAKFDTLRLHAQRGGATRPSRLSIWGAEAAELEAMSQAQMRAVE